MLTFADEVELVKKRLVAVRKADIRNIRLRYEFVRSEK